MRNIYHVFLEAVDPEQKAHASLRKRGPKILARLKRAASSFRRPKEPQEPDLAATAEAARNQLALVPLKAAPVSVDRPLAELSPEGVAAWLWVRDVTCNGCCEKLNRALSAVPGVLGATFDVDS